MDTFVKDQAYADVLLLTSADISTGTAFEVLYQKPSGVKGSWVGVLDGTKNIRYDIQAGDLNEQGNWGIQAKVTINAEVTYGKISRMQVTANLE